MNTPVIANSGFGDIDTIVSPARNASAIVADYEPATLTAALETILAATSAQRAAIRSASTEYSLESGVNRYEIVYGRLAGIAMVTSGPATEEGS
jgi:hypothetical protein